MTVRADTDGAHVAGGGFGASRRDSDSRLPCYSIIVIPTSSSPNFTRQDLWNHCAHSCHLELSSPNDHGRHGVEEWAAGKYRINFARESDCKEATRTLRDKPYRLDVKAAPPTLVEDVSHRHERVRILADHETSDSLVLSLRRGTVATLLEIHERGWYKLRVDGREGFFPKQHVEMIHEIGQLVVDTQECDYRFERQEIWEIFAGIRDHRFFTLCKFDQHGIPGVTRRGTKFIVSYATESEAEKALEFFRGRHDEWKESQRPEADIYIRKFDDHQDSEANSKPLEHALWVGDDSDFPIGTETKDGQNASDAKQVLTHCMLMQLRDACSRMDWLVLCL